jgi:hypothetical protein
MPECTLLPRVIDRSLLAYIQQYPFCAGSDQTLGRKWFAAFREHMEIRQSKVSRAIKPLDCSELADEASIRVAACDIGLREAGCDDRLRNRARKRRLARTDAKSILALGCGEEDEIVAPRALGAPSTADGHSV